MAQLHKKKPTEAISLQDKVKKERLLRRYEKGYRKHRESPADIRAKEKAELEALSQEDWS